MVEIILKDKIDQDKMKALLQLVKSLNLEVIVKDEYLLNEREKVEFSLSVGLWEDYSIDGNELRKQSWNIIE